MTVRKSTTSKYSHPPNLVFTTTGVNKSISNAIFDERLRIIHKIAVRRLGDDVVYLAR